MNWNIVGLLTFAFALRIVGINFGLPEILHADEPMVVHHAVLYGAFDFNPHYFKLPPLLSYILFGMYGIYYLVGTFMGWFGGMADFERLFITDPTSFYLIGRIFFGAVLGTAHIYVVYRFILYVFKNRWMAYLSAFVLSIVFLHVEQSHYLYHDMAMTLFILLTVYAALYIYEKKTLRYYILSGFLAGIATSFKYNAAVVAVTIFMAHFLKEKRPSVASVLLDKRIYICAIIMILTYLSTNPFSIIDFKTFYIDMKTQFDAEDSFSFFYHITYSLFEGISPLLTLLGIGGILYLFWLRDRIFIIAFSFPVIFYFFCIHVSQPHARYMVPLVPFLAMSSVFLIHRLFQYKIFSPLFLRFSFLAFIIVPLLIKTVLLNFLFLNGDTRLMAKQWIEKNILSGAKIAMDHTFFDPKLRQSPEQITQKINHTESPFQKRRLQYAEQASRTHPSYVVFYIVDKPSDNIQFQFSGPEVLNNWSDLKGLGIQYVVIHRQRPMKTKFYELLPEKAVCIKKISPYYMPEKTFSSDVVIDTAAPFLSSEIYSRYLMGYTIEIYKLL